MKSLWTTGIWLLAAAVLLHTGLFTPTLTAVTLFYYCVLVAGLCFYGLLMGRIEPLPDIDTWRKK